MMMNSRNMALSSTSPDVLEELCGARIAAAPPRVSLMFEVRLFFVTLGQRKLGIAAWRRRCDDGGGAHRAAVTDPQQ